MFYQESNQESDMVGSFAVESASLCHEDLYLDCSTAHFFLMLEKSNV